jgi:hypothetical protein
MTIQNEVSGKSNPIQDRYDTLIKFYEGDRKKKGKQAFQLQISTIVLSGLTPILILCDIPKPLQALPSALAGVSAALYGTLRPRDSYVRVTYVLEALKSEKFKFETRTTQDYSRDLDDYRVLENFVIKMESLVASEISSWRTLDKKSEASTNKTE